MELERLRKEYSAEVLDEQTVEADPFAQFTEWFEEANKAVVPEPEAMFLATVGAEGHPSGRIVLLKGFSQKGFVFFTNYDSKKGRDIRGNPEVALTFHWKELERQVRILGKAKKVPARTSDAYFDSRPAGSRISAVISPQSSVIPGRKFLEDRRSGLLDQTVDNKIRRPGNWGGFIVIPYHFEFWQGRESRLHDRIRYRLEKRKWTIERLAP